MTRRRNWLCAGVVLTVAALTAPSAVAAAADATMLIPPPPAGQARYAVEKGGVVLGEAKLRWQRDGNRYEVRLSTVTTGVTALILPFTEERISRGEVTPDGWWVPVEVRRERPERPPEYLVRDGKEVIVTRKGKEYRYLAAANAQDFLSLLFSLPEQVARGQTSGAATLLGLKGEKAIGYRLVVGQALPEGAAQPIVAATAAGDWQVTSWWATTPPARLVQLQVSGKEGAFLYRLLP